MKKKFTYSSGVHGDEVSDSCVQSQLGGSSIVEHKTSHLLHITSRQLRERQGSSTEDASTAVEVVPLRG